MMAETTKTAKADSASVNTESSDKPEGQTPPEPQDLSPRVESAKDLTKEEKAVAEGTREDFPTDLTPEEPTGVTQIDQGVLRAAGLDDVTAVWRNTDAGKEFIKGEDDRNKAAEAAFKS